MPPPLPNEDIISSLKDIDMGLENHIHHFRPSSDTLNRWLVDYRKNVVGGVFVSSVDLTAALCKLSNIIETDRKTSSLSTVIELAQMVIRKLFDRGIKSLQLKNGMTTPEQHFASNGENTEEEEVKLSVDASIEKLKRRYPNFQNSCEQILQIIARTIELIHATDEVTELEGKNLNHYFKKITEDAYSLRAGCTVSEALTLVWIGIHDRDALVYDASSITEEDVTERIALFINNLKHVSLGRTAGEAVCAAGIYNTIVETLDRIHPDVMIVRGQMILIKGQVTDQLHHFAKRFLSQLDLNVLQRIEVHWTPVAIQLSRNNCFHPHGSEKALTATHLKNLYHYLLQELSSRFSVTHSIHQQVEKIIQESVPWINIYSICEEKRAPRVATPKRSAATLFNPAPPPPEKQTRRGPPESPRYHML